MNFVDIHFHGLAGVDDGPKTEEEMFALVEAAYREGTRALCLTPHFHPGYFGDNREKTDRVFSLLQSRLRQTRPDLRLYLGNELRYDDSCLAWLESGCCRTLNGSRYVLVDFSAGAESRIILRGLDHLLGAGYVPVLAHAERYGKLDLREIARLGQRGVIIQVDGMSLFGGYGFGAKLRSRQLVIRHLADVVASDAHDLSSRMPVMKKSRTFVAARCGEEYADALCVSNSLRILDNAAVWKE